MNVSVGKTFEEFVQGKVASGEYASASEVVRDGLRLLKEKDLLREARLEAIKVEIQKGIDQAERGELYPGSEVMAEIKARLLDKKT